MQNMELSHFYSLQTKLPLPLADVYKAVMKWAVFAPALLHPLLYFAFSPEARHGAYIMFTRCCSCCCPKANVIHSLEKSKNH